MLFTCRLSCSFIQVEKSRHADSTSSGGKREAPIQWQLWGKGKSKDVGDKSRPLIPQVALILEVSLRSPLEAQSSRSVHVRATKIELASSGGNINFFNPGSREKEGELYLTYATDDRCSYPNT